MVGTRLSIDEYHQRYAEDKRAEYWFGEVRYKSVPTWLHSLLQGILVQVFTDAGYASGSELEFRIDPEWEPKPDVAAALRVEEPYPTRPVEVVAEVLSPADRMEDVKAKCAQYERIGIGRIFVFDPAARKGYEWRGGDLQAIESIRFDNGAPETPLDRVWAELDRRLSLGRNNDGRVL